MTLVAGQTIGAYRIVEQVGRGGMATVYKAHQAALARYVAVKVLPAYLADDPTFRERFQAEAVTIAKLRHPNILQVFDFGEEAGLHYIVTEFVDGGTLAEQLGKPLPADYVVKVLTPIASAVDYAHAREVLHRDIKPANVLLARDGTPVVSDFGLARMMGSIERLTRTGAVVGTPEYMAPEQASGENAGTPADRYAVAIVAYEMLVGSVPYSADTPLATLIAHLHKPLPLPTARNPLLSPALEAVLLKGLAKDPADRHETAAAFVRALEAAERGISPPVVAAAQPPVATLPRSEPAQQVAIPLPVPAAATVTAPGRRGLPLPLLAGAGLLALVLAGGAVFALTRDGAAPPGASDTSTSRSAVPRGELIWQATLDDTSGDLNPPAKSGDETATSVRTRGGAIELEVLKTGTGASVTTSFRRQLPTNYVAEFTFKVKPQSALNVNFGIRNDSATQRRHNAAVNVGSELLEFGYFEFAKQPPGAQVLSGRVAVPRLQSGREVILAVVAHAKGYAVYLDGQVVIPEVADDRLATFASTLSVSVGGGTGLVTISGVRVYAYTGSETASAPTGAPSAPLPAGGAPAATGTCSPAVGGTNVIRECRFSGLPPGTATFSMTRDGGAMGAPPGGQTVESDGSVTFRMQPGTTGRFVVTATAGGVSRSLSFEAR